MDGTLPSYEDDGQCDLEEPVATCPLDPICQSGTGMKTQSQMTL